jgi:branched-chain amino acid transport system substrate-binding protein
MINDRGEMFYSQGDMSLIAASPRHRVPLLIRTGVLLWCFVLLVCCGEKREPPTWSGPAKIAVVVPHTGPLMEEGQMLQFGALMASREAESRAVDLSLEVVVYDSPCDPEEGVATAKRLTTDVTISAVIGYLCAETLGAVLPLYQDASLALINPTVSAEYVRQGETRNLFSLLYGDREQAAFLATYAIEGLGLDRVAILRDNSAYGSVLSTSFEAEATRLDLEVVANVAINSDQAGAAQAVRFLKSASPETVFLAASPKPASLFLLERQRQHLSGVVLGTDQLADLDFYEMAGQAAEGLLVCQSILFEAENPKKSRFVRRFEQLYKRRPDWIAAAGYDAMRLALEVLNSSGPERRVFLQNLRTISGPDTAFQGLSGPVFFKDDGTSRRPLFVGIIQNGTLQAAKPPTVEFPVALSTEK